MMRKILVSVILLVSFYAKGQYSPTATKTKFVNGIALGTKDTNTLKNAGDTIVFTVTPDSVPRFRYKGYYRALAFGGAGGSLATLTLGTDLSGTSYNGSTAVTVNNTSTLASVTGRGNTSGSGVILTQTANASNGYGLFVKRITDVSPVGYLIQGSTSDGATALFSVESVDGRVFSTGSYTGTSFIKTGGTSSQFLKADGSVDASTYLTSSTNLWRDSSANFVPNTGYGNRNLRIPGGSITASSDITGGRDLIISRDAYVASLAAAGDYPVSGVAAFQNTSLTGGYAVDIRGGISKQWYALKVSATASADSIANFNKVDISFYKPLNLGTQTFTTSGSVTGGAASFTTGTFTGALTSGIATVKNTTGAEALKLQGVSAGDAVYHGYYNSAGTRRAYQGYGSVSSSNFTILNEEAGSIILGTNSTTALTINSSQAIIASSSFTATDYRISALNTAPATAASTGTTGEIRYVNGFIYVCVATNTWQRVAIATW